MTDTTPIETAHKCAFAMEEPLANLNTLIETIIGVTFTIGSGNEHAKVVLEDIALEMRQARRVVHDEWTKLWDVTTPPEVLEWKRAQMAECVEGPASEQLAKTRARVVAALAEKPNLRHPDAYPAERKWGLKVGPTAEGIAAAEMSTLVYEFIKLQETEDDGWDIDQIERMGALEHEVTHRIAKSLPEIQNKVDALEAKLKHFHKLDNECTLELVGSIQDDLMFMAGWASPNRTAEASS